MADENINNVEKPAESVETEKTFTQSDVDRMIAENKNKIFSDIGIGEKDIEAVKEFIKNRNANENKTADNSAEIEKLNNRAIIAEIKAESMMMGIKTNFVDDATILIMNKIKNGADVKTAISEMKTKYPVWFGADEEDKKENKKVGQRGTGSAIKQDDKSDKNNSLGKRLAINAKAKNPKKFSYWG